MGLGSGASRSGGGEDVTIAGRTTEQGNIGLLSQWTMEGYKNEQ